jgi:hypothetical protein
VYADGASALPDWEREASIREFYGNQPTPLLCSRRAMGNLLVTVDF